MHSSSPRPSIHRHPGGCRAVVRLTAAWLLALGVLGHASEADAQQTLYWSGSAGTGAPTWNTPLAWSTGSATWVAPAVAPGANDTAVFGIASLSGPQLVSITGTQSVYGLVFSSTAPTALSGTNGSSVLTVGAGGISVTPAGNFYVFGLDDSSTALTLALSGSTGQRWNNQSSNVPAIHGPLVRGRGATLTMLAPFALQTATNTFGMLGPWATYEGGSAVGYLTVGAGGTMTAFTAATPAATAAAVTDTTGTMNYDVAAPGLLGPNASFNTLRYTGGTGTISGSFAANGLMNAGDPGNGTLAFTGRITAGASGELVVSAARTIELQGTIADGGGPSTLVKTGTGTLILSGNNSYTGGTVVNDGTVMMFQPFALGSGTSSLTVSSGTLSIGGYSLPVSSLSGGPGGMITGNGTLTVWSAPAANSTYGGGFASGGMPSAPTLVKSGSGTLTLSGSNSLAGIAVDGGRLVAGHANALGGGTTAIAVNAGTLDIGTVSPVIGSLTGYSGAVITTASTAGVRTLTTSIASGSPVYAGSIRDNGAGTIGLTTYGAASLTLSGSNSFTGPTRLVAGGVTIANRDALAGTTLELQAGDTGSLTYYGLYSGTVNIGGLAGSRSFDVSSGLTTAIGGNGQSTTYSGTLAGSGALVKQGAGTLTLTGSAPMQNPYAGVVRIAGGTLALGNPSTLASATVDMGYDDAGTLGFSGTTPQTYGLAALTGWRGVNLGGNTLAIGTWTSSTSTYYGTLSGSGGLLKHGSSTLVLSGSNSYTGATRIEGGTLRIDNREALAGSTLDLQTGDTGSLWINVYSGTVSIGGLSGSRPFDVSSARTTAIGGNGQSTTYSGTLSGSGTLVKQGAGTLTLTGSAPIFNPYAGVVRIASGTLALGNPTALAAATVDMNYYDAGVLGFSGTTPQTYVLAALTGWRGVNLGGNTLALGTWTSSTSTYDGTLSGSGGLHKYGSSTLVLSGSNSYTGATRIEGGTLVLSGSNSSPGTTRIEGGTLRIDNRNALAGTTLDLQASDTGSLSINVYSGTVNIGGLAGSRSFDVSFGRTTAIGGNGQSTTYAGTLSGSGTLVKQGAGTLTLTGSAPMLNPYTGVVRIASGTLALGNPSTLASATVDMNYDDAGTLGFSGTTPQTYGLAALTGSRGVNLGGNTLAIGTWTSSTSTYQGTLSGSGGVLKYGSSTLVLSGSNSYTGTTRIEGGTLRIDNRDALAGTTLDLQASDTGSLWINSTGTVSIGGLTGSRSVSIPSFATVAVGGNGQSTTYSGTIQNSGAFVKQGAGTLTLTATGALSGGTVTVNEGRLVGSTVNLGGTIFNNATLEFAQATSGTFGGFVITTSTAAGVQTVKSGVGTLALTGTIFGNLTVSGGRLVTQAANVSGGQLVADATVEFDQASNATFAGPLLGSGSLAKTGGGTLTLQGGTFNGTTTVSAGRLVASAATLRGPIVANATLEFAQATNGEHISVISGSGTVVKSGGGTLLLSGANLFTGTTSVTAGILATASAERLADTSTVSLGADGSLRLGGDETIATLLGSGSVNLQTFQLTIAGGGTFAGGMFGSGGLTKAGSGLLALTGSSGFLGATRLNAGTLVLSNSSALSSFTTLSIASGATLVLDTDVRVFAFTNSGGTITGPGQLLTSATTTTSGTLASLSDASGPEGYSVGLLKTSTGTLVVSGSTSFTGGIVVEQGTVQLDAGGSFASTNVVEVQSGATLDLNGQSQTVAALAGGGDVALGGGTLTVASTTDTVFDGSIAGGSLVKSGGSSLDLTGSSTVSTATVSEGLLSVNGTLTGDVSVAPEGVLGGAGTIIGDVAVSGTHAPGNSPDISTIVGDLSYALGASVVWELAANTDAQGPLGARTHDQIVVGEDLAFNGATSLVLSFFDEDPNSSWVSTVDWADPFWDEDRSWTLWDVSGTTSGFANLSIAPGSWLDAGGTAFAIARPDGRFLLQRSGSDVLLLYAVPEPGTLALAALGLAGLCCLNRRRPRKKGEKGDSHQIWGRLRLYE